MNDFPKKGDPIYVPSAYHVYRGIDDFEGGLAVIDRVEFNDRLPQDHVNYCMIGIESNPGTMYNYRILSEKQESLKEQYGDNIAHANPDLRPEFNQPNADWK